MTCALAIDLGTSGVKAAVIDGAGNILGTGSGELEFTVLPDGGVEQDAEVVWRRVVAACAAAAAASGLPRDEIAAVCCTSQYSSIVPVDADGVAIAPMILYLDGRGGSAAAALMARRPEAIDTWRTIHGRAPGKSGVESLAHMVWLRQARPEVYARAASLLEPMDYIVARLTGERCATQCTAYMSLLIDNRHSGETCYNEALVALSGLDEEKLPPLIALDGVVGQVRPALATKLGIASHARVVAGANDTHALAMGTGTFTGNRIGVSFGTTSVGVAFVEGRHDDPANQLASIPAPLIGRYVMAGENGLGAGGLKHVLERLIYTDDILGAHAADDPFAALDGVVAATEVGAGGALFLPWLGGSGAPAASGSVRGGFVNLSLATRRVDLVRAAMEGIALNFRWMFDACERFCGGDFEEIRFAGGGALSDGWSSILADVLGQPVAQMENPRFVNCLGTAMLAFHHMGLRDLSDLASWGRVRAVRDPDPARARLYAHIFRAFVAAHGRARELATMLAEQSDQGEAQ